MYKNNKCIQINCCWFKKIFIDLNKLVKPTKLFNILNNLAGTINNLVKTTERFSWIKQNFG